MTAYATTVGDRRQDDAESIGRAAGPAPVPIDQQRQNNIWAAIAERATQGMFPKLHWYAYRKHGITGIPDLGDFLCIDTKSTMSEDKDPLMRVLPDEYDEAGTLKRLRVHRKWAYVFAVGCDHPYWWFPGWLWGEEVLAFPIVTGPRGPSHVIPASQLHPIYKLQRLYTERLKQHEQEKQDAV